MDKMFLNLTFNDVRNSRRGRKIQLANDFTEADEVVNIMNALSKSKIIKRSNVLTSVGDVTAPPLGSEVGDSARLYFVNADGDGLHFDLIDAPDDLFQAQTGAGANIVREWDEIGTATDTTALAFQQLIAKIVTDNVILLSDGEEAYRYLDGKRLT